jgi:hypothetical protein
MECLKMRKVFLSGEDKIIDLIKSYLFQGLLQKLAIFEKLGEFKDCIGTIGII